MERIPYPLPGRGSVLQSMLPRRSVGTRAWRGKDIVKDIKIIVNPISGCGQGGVKGKALTRFLGEQGLVAHLFITQKTGDAEREARKTNIPIMVIGGDGTVNEVINGLDGRDVPITVLPLGTANLLSREFDLPKTQREILSLLKSGKTRLLDTGLVSGAINRRFLLVASLGLDAEITRLMKEMRKGAIHLHSYFIPFCRAMRDYALPVFTIVIDGQIVSNEATMVVIGNVKNYAGYFSITYQAVPDDGWLDVCVFSGQTKMAYLRYLVGIILRRPTIWKDVTYYRGKGIEILSSDRMPVELDGDFAGYTPFKCQVSPGSVSLIYP